MRQRRHRDCARGGDGESLGRFSWDWFCCRACSIISDRKTAGGMIGFDLMGGRLRLLGRLMGSRFLFAMRGAMSFLFDSWGLRRLAPIGISGRRGG
jgi:hypothetical protein